jgi:hypothetical protein
VVLLFVIHENVKIGVSTMRIVINLGFFIVFLVVAGSGQAAYLTSNYGTSNLAITNHTGKILNVAVEYLDPQNGPCPDNSLSCFIRRLPWEQMEPGLTRSKLYSNFTYTSTTPNRKFPRPNNRAVVTSISWVIPGVGTGQVGPLNFQNLQVIITGPGDNYLIIRQ